MAQTQKIAIILIRGLINVRHDIKGTLTTFRLLKKHTCVVVPDTPSIRSAANKCKDYVTYGELDTETEKLLEKRGTAGVYHLSSPKGGFERKGIKVPFTNGGVLGYRSDKINDLLRRMI